MAARSAQNRRAVAPGVNYHRQNQQQLQEQAAINRERKKQMAAEEERQEHLKKRLASQYAHARTPMQKQQPQQQQQQPPRRAAPPQASGEKIEVFIRETEPGANSRMFAYFDGEPGVQHRMHAEPEAAHDEPPAQREPARGAPGGVRGAARRTSESAAAEPPAAPSPGAVSSRAPASEAGRAARPGQVPRYLTKRKQELLDEKEELLRAAEEQRRLAQFPPGMVPLEEDKRQDILKALEDRRQEVMLAINKLPMRFDTHAVRKRREALEDEIREVESQVAKYSRKQVFVPADGGY
eukprot:TRINITY_DN630_c1_g2_i1.p2 TRINITY_DN630_c1_g2~~TRINITY_DN630_c1_g2_i1.p2  ORF type:complete len:320 (+),score=145.80 TRINITY_DN630_c1_g2_i1:78-962(+)